MSTIDLPCLLNNLPITTLTGVGPIVQQKLTQLNIKNIIDLLFHLPLRYQNKSKIYNIANADINQEILVRGHIINVYQTKTKTQKSQYTCTIKDHTGILNLIFFNLTSFQRNTLKKNSYIHAFGEIKQWGLHYSMMHPEFTASSPSSETVGPSQSAGNAVRMNVRGPLPNLSAVDLDLAVAGMVELHDVAVTQHRGVLRRVIELLDDIRRHLLLSKNRSPMRTRVFLETFL